MQSPGPEHNLLQLAVNAQHRPLFGLLSHRLLICLLSVLVMLMQLPGAEHNSLQLELVVDAQQAQMELPGLIKLDLQLLSVLLMVLLQSPGMDPNSLQSVVLVYALQVQMELPGPTEHLSQLHLDQDTLKQSPGPEVNSLQLDRVVNVQQAQMESPGLLKLDLHLQLE